MPVEVIDEWVSQTERLLSEGTPLEVPVAIPQAILFGMIRTLQQGQEDRKMLGRALSTLRFSIQEAVDDPEEHWCDISDMAMALRKHLEAEPLPGEYADLA
ncbi:MAG: hypothetical protein EBY17_29745 [Acidobacteriia bacterium]|nr:hypothetical protein [Terriglobia bacterium]